jgi:hypothetical protein
MTKRTPSTSASAGQSSHTRSSSKSPSPLITSSSFPSPPTSLPRDASRLSMVAASPSPSVVQSPTSPTPGQAPVSPEQVLTLAPSSPPVVPPSPSYTDKSAPAQASPRRLRFPQKPLVIMNPDESSSSQEASPADYKPMSADIPPPDSLVTPRPSNGAAFIETDDLMASELALRTPQPHTSSGSYRSETSVDMSMDDQTISYPHKVFCGHVSKWDLKRNLTIPRWRTPQMAVYKRVTCP